MRGRGGKAGEVAAEHSSWSPRPAAKERLQVGEDLRGQYHEAGVEIRDPVADLFQYPELAAPEMGATTGRTRPANQRLVSVTATARMPTVPK